MCTFLWLIISAQTFKVCHKLLYHICVHTVGGREIEFVAFLNVEEAVPAVNIAYDAIDTLTVQRMGVWFHLVCEGSSRHAVMCKIHEVRAVLRTVPPRIGVEEALLQASRVPVASEALFF